MLAKPKPQVGLLAAHPPIGVLHLIGDRDHPAGSDHPTHPRPWRPDRGHGAAPCFATAMSTLSLANGSASKPPTTIGTYRCPGLTRCWPQLSARPGSSRHRSRGQMTKPGLLPTNPVPVPRPRPFPDSPHPATPGHR
jgi:hypothetical protein